MRYTSTQRKILSAVLLLLYIFIALPVQLWHHHKQSSAKALSELKIGKANIDTQSQECKICQHTYTDYTDDAVTVNVNSFVLKADVKNILILSYKFLHFVSPGNKSPPLV